MQTPDGGTSGRGQPSDMTPERATIPVGRSSGKPWKRVLLIAFGLLSVVTIGAVWLFSGSVVTCVETSADDARSLHCEFVAAAPQSTLWRAFTNTDVPIPYYFDAILEAEMHPGGRWRFVTDNRERLLASGEILTIEHPDRFAQTFEAADLTDPPSRITVELEAVAAGTRVLLVHDQFQGETTTYRRFRKAHPIALSALKSYVETGELPVRARIYTAIFKPGMKFATVRAEPWGE